MRAPAEHETPVDPAPVSADRPAREKIDHLYWVRDLELAAKLGLAAVSLCGSKVEKAPATEYVQVVGGLMPVSKPRDCKRCLRVLEATSRRNWEKRNRS